MTNIQLCVVCLGYGEYFKNFNSELSKRRKSYIPDFRTSINSVLAANTNEKYDLPTYIKSLHSVGRSAYKRTSISRPDLSDHVTKLDSIAEVSIQDYIFPIMLEMMIRRVKGGGRDYIRFRIYKNLADPPQTN